MNIHAAQGGKMGVNSAGRSSNSGFSQNIHQSIHVAARKKLKQTAAQIATISLLAFEIYERSFAVILATFPVTL